MKPIHFTYETNLEVSREHVFEKFLELESWDTFTGYGILPGIKKAEFEIEKEGVTGSVVQVENTDGSTHKEKILTWIPCEVIEVKLMGFSAPLSGIATHFVERFEFREANGSDQVKRTFLLHPKMTATRPLLWIISFFLKGAVKRHTDMIASGADAHP